MLMQNSSVNVDDFVVWFVRLTFCTETKCSLNLFAKCELYSILFSKDWYIYAGKYVSQ